MIENDKDPWFFTRIEASRKYQKEAYDIMCKYYEHVAMASP
jgi:hypothetical protein